MTDYVMKYDQYESFLKKSLFTDYVLLFFALLAIIGMVVFALWWRHCEKKDALKQQNSNSSPESKIDKKIYVISAILILAVTIGAVSSVVDSIIKTSHDIKNQAYVFVDENFIVSETEWWGRWNDTTYTIEFEKNGVKTKIHPNLKFWDLPPGEYHDTIFVYSLESEIILEVNGDTGDGSLVLTESRTTPLV